MTVRAAWWEDDAKGVRYVSVLAAQKAIEQRQMYRADAFLHYARLYAGAKIDGLDLNNYACAAGGGFVASDIQFNVVKNLSDTLTAKVTKSRPLPMFLTSGGDWSAQKKAKALGKFVEGMFDEGKVFEKTTASCLDATVHGPGFVHVYQDGKRIHVEKVRPWELFVDDAEAVSGEPRTIFRKRPANRRQLAAAYPQHAAVIMRQAESGDYSHDHEMIDVVEAWHLRSSDDSDDGRYVVCIDGADLSDEPYEREYLPFPRLTMTPPMMGYYGTGLGELLTGIQYEINFTAMRIQRAHENMGGAHWVVQAGSIEPKMMDNGHGTVWTVNGPPPTPVTPAPIHPDAYQYLEMLKRYASEVCGVSQMSAQSQKPAGLNSGKALQVYDDIESERFIVFGRSWENFHLEIARQMVDCARELAEENPSFATKAKRSGMLRDIKWKDVALAETDYVMQVFPTSALAKTPAAKLQQVNDLFSMGLIGPEQCKRLLDFPDLEDAASLDTASYDLAMEQLERMLDDGETQDPIPEMNLAESYRLGQLTLVRSVMRGAPEDHQQLVRRWLSIIEQWQASTQPEQAPAMPPPPPVPGAAPEMPMAA